MTRRSRSAVEALERLRAGNRRFVRGGPTPPADFEFLETQEPFAVILGCSDSRVPPEQVFDQGAGELFVGRIAGNIVNPAVVGCVEYAVGECGVQLVVVLGHARCGAVLATIQALDPSSSGMSPNLEAVVDYIRPTVEALLPEHSSHQDEAPASGELWSRSIRANVHASVDHLRHRSELLADHVRNAGLVIVGAEYSLETGEVDFFEGVPAID